MCFLCNSGVIHGVYGLRVRYPYIRVYRTPSKSMRATRLPHDPLRSMHASHIFFFESSHPAVPFIYISTCIYTKTFPDHTLTTLSYSIMSRNKVDSYSYLDMMRDSGLHKSMMEESIRFDHALNIQVHSSIEKFVNTLLSKNVFVSRALRAWEILAYGASTAMVLYGVSLVIEAIQAGRPPPPVPPSHRGPETST